MTDTYTIEDIDAIYNNIPASNPALTRDQLKAKLTRPVWMPQKGEVYYSGNPGIPVKHIDDSVTRDCIRPLNRQEVPALGVAIAVLVNMKARANYNGLGLEIERALIHIRSMIGED
jgi:hypothetical protein